MIKRIENILNFSLDSKFHLTVNLLLNSHNCCASCYYAIAMRLQLYWSTKSECKISARRVNIGDTLLVWQGWQTRAKRSSSKRQDHFLLSIDPSLAGEEERGRIHPSGGGNGRRREYIATEDSVRTCVLVTHRANSRDSLTDDALCPLLRARARDLRPRQGIPRAR